MARIPHLLGVTMLAAVLVAACSDGEPARPALSPASTSTAESPTPSPTSPATTGAASTPAPTTGDIEPLDHDIENAMEHVRVLSVAIGPRVSGSRESRETVAYIADAFRGYGYAVEVMEFEYATRFRMATVTVDGETIGGVALNGRATPEQSAEGAAFGSGSPARASPEGAISIAERGTAEPGDGLRYLEAARDEAVGLVIVNQQRWGLWGSPIPARNAIPVVLVPHTEAGRFERAVADGATVTLTIGPARPIAMNVIARPADGARCDILAGGHHDTVAAAPGAIDNASGVAIVLELARLFAEDGLDDGLCFATFGAEESGLFGSAALAGRWAESGVLPRVMVNFDVTARGDAVEVIGSSDLMGRAVQLLAAAGIPAYPSALPRGFGSDHQSFSRAGVPVLFFSDGDVSLIHSPADVIERVEPVALDRIGDGAALVMAALLAEIAGGP